MTDRKRVSNPKRHHYVPKMLLQNFTDDNGRLYVFDRRLPEKGVRISSPKQAFVENNMYLQYAYGGGEKDYSIEHSLSQLEGYASLVIMRVIDAARAGKRPTLSAQEKRSWDTYFCSQLTRTPDVRPSDQELDEARLQIEDDILRSRTLSSTAISNLKHVVSDPEIVSRSNQSVKANLAIPKDSRILDVISGKGILVAWIKRSNRSFVIGSKPIVIVRPEANTHLADPSVFAWLPVAYNVAVTPALTAGEVELFEITNNQFVRGLNNATLDQSDAIAGRSRILVESLTKKLRNSSN